MSTKLNALREQYPQGKIHLIDVIKVFDPTKNKHLTKILLDEYLAKVSISHYIPERIEAFVSDNDINNDWLKIKYNRTLSIIAEDVYDILGSESLYYVYQFKKYWNEGKISHNTKLYKSMSDIRASIIIAETADFKKSDAKRVHKIYENETWLLILPLSLKASQLYGAGTKWCTTNRAEERHFYNYTASSLLVYVINKKTNEKFAYLYAGVNEVGSTVSQFYNSNDALVDSMNLNIPYQILLELKNFITTSTWLSNKDHPNFDLRGYNEYQLSRQGCNEVARPRLMEVTVEEASIINPEDDE